MAKTLIVSTIELAKHLGITKQGLYKRQELPPADFTSLGGKPCWFPETVDAWNQQYLASHAVGRPAQK